MDFVNICCKALYFRGSLSICPAYAGMIPALESLEEYVEDLSRVCGDDPVLNELRANNLTFVPRMRG